MEPDTQSRDAEVKIVEEVMRVFGTSKLTIEGSSYDQLLEMCLTDTDLKKCVKTLRPLLEQNVFDDLWISAHGASVVVSAQSLTMKDLFRFRPWVISSEGQSALADVRKKARLARKGNASGACYKSDQVDLLCLYQAESDARSRKISAAKEERNKKISEGKRMIEEARREFDKESRKINRKHRVSAGYTPLPIEELRKQCWIAYLQQMQREGQPPCPKSSASLEAVVEKFGDDIKQRHLYEYAQLNSEALVEYGKYEIKRLKKDTSN